MKRFKQEQKHWLVGITITVMIALAFGGCDSLFDSDNNDDKSGKSSGSIQNDAGAKQLARDIYYMMYYYFDSTLPENYEFKNYPYNGQTGTVTVTGTKTKNPYGSYNYSYITNVSLVFSDFSTSYSNLELISGSGTYYYWYRTSEWNYERKNEGNITLNSCEFSYIYSGKKYTGTVSLNLNFERITSLFFSGTIIINGQTFNLYFC